MEVMKESASEVSKESSSSNDNSGSFVTTVEDLINKALGPADESIVDFKLMQKVLLLLARQLRLLDQKVIICLSPLEAGTADADAVSIQAGGKSPRTKPGAKGQSKHTKGKTTGFARTSQKGTKLPKHGSDHSDSSRRTSIDVVTLSQFKLLEARVKELQEKTGPFPELTFPDTKTLAKEIVRGKSSLTDTMEAMKLNARVHAAEQAVERLAYLLTQLQPERLIRESEYPGMPIMQGPKIRKSVLIDPVITTRHKTTDDRHSSFKSNTEDRLSFKPVQSHIMSKVSVHTHSERLTPPDAVTEAELSIILAEVKNDILKNVDMMTQKTYSTAEHAVSNTLDLAEKFEQAARLDLRIEELKTIVSDYLNQIGGFDEGIATQIQNFLEQMGYMRTDLQFGMDQMEALKANSEAMAILELTDRIQHTFGEVDNLSSAQVRLHSYQKKLTSDLNSLIETLESHGEQKVDRDEVADCLRDKANISQLAGLLHEREFEEAKRDLNRRIDACFSKFQGQESVWKEILKELHEVLDRKADLTYLLTERDEVHEILKELEARINCLAEVVGEPKAALVTRMLSRHATCGLCATPALMESTDPRSQGPPALPAFKPPPESQANLDPCNREIKLFGGQTKVHLCNRYAGGSHTLVNAKVTREMAESPATDCLPIKKFFGLGSDGRFYKLEENLEPCKECNEEQSLHIVQIEMPQKGEGQGEPLPPPPPLDETGDHDDKSSPGLRPAVVATDINVAFNKYQ